MESTVLVLFFRLKSWSLSLTVKSLSWSWSDTVQDGCSGTQSPAWRHTMLPQFASACRRRARSTSTPLCRIKTQIPPFKLSVVGGRAFPVAATQCWNRLPGNVTSANSLSAFQQQLKHTLFQQSFPDIIQDPVWPTELPCFSPCPLELAAYTPALNLRQL